MNMSQNLKFIDLFAGIGGFHLAFKSIGSECVFACEIDKFARQTYKVNHEISEDIFMGDIMQVDEKKVPMHDILCAGFPCQPFSNAGLKRGFEDVRGNLFFHIARIIKHHKPQVVFLENVKGLRTHNNGQTFETIKNTLKDLGYFIHYKILNARSFGVPQNRERIYIVCFSENISFEFPEGSDFLVKVGDILETKVADKYTISDKMWEGHKKRKERHKANGKGFGYSIFNADSQYTSTISARYYKDGSEALIEQKNKNPRVLTPRETARLQGFPESFIIPVSNNQAYKQFGNSVAIPVIIAIAEQIKNALVENKMTGCKVNLFEYYEDQNQEITTC